MELMGSGLGFIQCLREFNGFYLIWLKWGSNVKINGGPLLLRLSPSGISCLVLDQGKLLLALFVIVTLQSEMIKSAHNVQ